MNILVTGARGFVGKNLCEALRNIRDGKDRSFDDIEIGEIFEYDIDNSIEELNEFCQKADFVFNLAGVNGPGGELPAVGADLDDVALPEQTDQAAVQRLGTDVTDGCAAGCTGETTVSN